MTLRPISWHCAAHPRHGDFCWSGLATSDPPAAAAFYTRLFGWEKHPLPGADPTTVSLLMLGAEPVAVLYEQTPQARAAGVAPHWTPFITVDSVEAAAGQVPAFGGTVLREPLHVKGAGRVLAAADSSGAIVALWEPRGHDGIGFTAQAGHVCWTELVTTRPRMAKAFYRELLGWDYEVVGGRTFVNNHDRRNGAVSGYADDLGRAGSYWLTYVMVEHVDATIRDARAAGGALLADAIDSPFGRAAVLADPLDAQFAICSQS